jgi:tetratricopeptide (TPR) repeat protein
MIKQKNNVYMISIRPDIYLGYYNMGRVLAKTGEYAEAEKYLEKSIELKPNNIYAYMILANSLIYSKEFDKSIEALLKVRKIEPDFAKAYYLLNVCYIELGRYDMLEKLLTANIKSNESYRRAFTGTADKLLEKHHVRLAHEYYLRAIKLKPDSEYVLNTLSWLEAASNVEGVHNPAQSLQYAQKVCKLNGNKNAGVLNTLALAYAANGEFKKAVETAEKAIEIASSEKNAALVKAIHAKLELYKAGKTYSDPGLK